MKTSMYFLANCFFTYDKAQYSYVTLIVWIAGTGCQHAVTEGTHYYGSTFYH